MPIKNTPTDMPINNTARCRPDVSMPGCESPTISLTTSPHRPLMSAIGIADGMFQPHGVWIPPVACQDRLDDNFKF